MAVLFGTHLLGGVAAFGSTLLALPLLILVGWQVQPAVALLLTVGTAQALQVSLLTWRSIEWRTLRQIVLVAGIGIPIGLLLGSLLPERGFAVFLGVLLVAAGASRLLEYVARADYRPPAWVLTVLLFVGGVVHGAFGSGGSTLTVFARYVLKEKSAFRATLSIMWVVLNSVVLIALAVQGGFTLEAAWAAVPGVPVVLVATWLGHRAVRRLSQEQFANVVAALLCLAGILTIVRNLG